MSEVVIVGGGLAGSAAAIALAKAGRDVTLIEKESAPHDKVCGEFLSHEAVAYLSGLGIDLAALGAVAIDGVRFAGDGFSYCKLPFVARSLSRRVLDEALLTQAIAGGATVLRGVTVQGIEADVDRWQVKTGSAGNFEAATVFLASGKHDVRGHKRGPGRQNDLVGFKMHFMLSTAQHAALGSAVELFVFNGGYGGLEPIEDGKANLCFLIQRNALGDGDWDRVLTALCATAPLLALRLAGSIPLWNKPLAISAIPYGYVRCDSEGLWRLGDQAAVIPSFSGDGMAIALHSARLAASAYLAGNTAMQYQAKLARDVERQVRIATTISRALVSPVGQPLCRIAAAWIPTVMGITAKATRIPHRAIAA